MRFAIPACIALAALLCFSSSQTPPGGQTPPVKPEKPVETLPLTRSKSEKVFIQAVEDRMQGSWRLTAFESPFLEKEYRQEVGFMVISGNYFSFEMHLGWTVPNGSKLDHRDFLSGTHRFELDERSRMTTSSVIGSSLDKRGNLIFEPPGTHREYDVDVVGSRLVLKSADGRKFTFERMVDSHARVDIFGRPIKEKPEDADKTDAGAPKKEPPKSPSPPEPPKKD
jgi:hypothetical protein